jgi:hypothetical protein
MTKKLDYCYKHMFQTIISIPILCFPILCFPPAILSYPCVSPVPPFLQSYVPKEPLGFYSYIVFAGHLDMHVLCVESPSLILDN